jgi:lipoyl(octanoyl) transferase
MNASSSPLSTRTQSTMHTRFLGLVDYLPTYEAMQVFTAARSHEIRGKNELQTNKTECDQLWICEHPSVFTQGLAGKAAHVLHPGNIPVVQTNRGGQVTYHGPGQVVAYPLIDLKAAGYYVKEYVFKIEEAVIKTLAAFNVTGHRVRGAPGIYVRTDDPASHAQLLRSDGQPITDADLKQLATKELGSGPNYPANYPDLKQLAPKQLEKELGPDPNYSSERIGKIAALGIKVSRHFTYHGVALNVAMDLEPFTRIDPCGYAGLQTVDLRTIGVDVAWQEAAQVLSQKLMRYLAP